MVYLVKTPWWMKKCYPRRTWHMGEEEKVIYLTFDDGPQKGPTDFVLDELSRYNAKATFFCIGKNVVAEPGLYRRILSEGHSTGNHTNDHFNGWKVDDAGYADNINKAAKLISSDLFRPPYGRMRSSQVRSLPEAMGTASPKVIMWSVLSGDFDRSISHEKCLENVIANTKAGSIIVFHDSHKAFPHLQFALPRVLEHFSKNGYGFSSIKIESGTV